MYVKVDRKLVSCRASDGDMLSTVSEDIADVIKMEAYKRSVLTTIFLSKTFPFLKFS